MATAAQEAQQPQDESEDEESEEELITETAAKTKGQTEDEGETAEQPTQESDDAEGAEDVEGDDSSTEDEGPRRKFNFDVEDQEADDGPRTKVLTVQELEELFVKSAPDLAGAFPILYMPQNSRPRV